MTNRSVTSLVVSLNRATAYNPSPVVSAARHPVGGALPHRDRGRGGVAGPGGGGGGGHHALHAEHRSRVEEVLVDRGDGRVGVQ